MARRRKKLTYSQILGTAKTVLYNHLQALLNMPSTKEQVEQNAEIPAGFLSTTEADLVRKCVNDLWKISQEAGAGGKGGDLSMRSTSDVASHLDALLEKQGADRPSGRGNRAAQA